MTASTRQGNLRVSSLPNAVTGWGDKASTQLSLPGFDLWCFDPKPSALPTASIFIKGMSPTYHFSQ